MRLSKTIIDNMRMVHPRICAPAAGLVVPTVLLFEIIRDAVSLHDMGVLAAAATRGGHAHVGEDGTVLFLWGDAACVFDGQDKTDADGPIRLAA